MILQLKFQLQLQVKSKFGSCNAQDHKGSQSQVTIGLFELPLSLMQVNLTHEASNLIRFAVQILPWSQEFVILFKPGTKKRLVFLLISDTKNIPFL